MHTTGAKSMVLKKKDVLPILQSLAEDLQLYFRVEDDKGMVLFDNLEDASFFTFPVMLDDEVLGRVKGDEHAKAIAHLLTQTLQKDQERKRLGTEVLNLYQEINLIFNFSEKLAQTIDAPAICSITVEEARRVIQSDHGVIVLWSEQNRRLEVMALSGQVFFNPEKINAERGFLLQILLSGQSEILTDTRTLAESEIILPSVKAVIYAALKVKHRVMGALVLASMEDVQYTAADLKLLTTLALQSSGAIESALLYEKNISEAREREESMRRIYEVTGKFVPYEFIGALGHQVITDVKLGDHIEKNVTVLFSDIREYTRISEKMTPQENFHFVCSFNERMGPIIRKHRGFVNQYLGDAIMAIFPGSASDALAAAVEMRHALNELNTERLAGGLEMIQIGIGMHSGPLIMGITGDLNRLDATTISDTVNTASRLESLTKYYHAGIILSDASLRQIMDESSGFHLRHLGLVQLKGKEEPIRIHECFDGDPELEVQHKIMSRAMFNGGMQLYLNESFAGARQAFDEVLELDPADRTARFFQNKCTELMNSTNASHPVGVVEMQEK
jgi:class 3 adenylate cyclase